jgi:hypothetical protein
VEDAKEMRKKLEYNPRQRSICIQVNILRNVALRAEVKNIETASVRLGKWTKIIYS